MSVNRALKNIIDKLDHSQQVVKVFVRNVKSYFY